MKKKAKKVSLNAETIRNLDASRMRDSAGGNTNLCTGQFCTHTGVCCTVTATYACSACRPCD